jgi:flagellar hook protein FlgE
MSTNIALTGLRAQKTALEVVGNNIANVNTDGYKSSEALFSDMFTTSGAAGTQTGLGTKVSKIKKDFSEGDVRLTSRAFDLSLNSGNSFFVLQDQATGQQVISRAGQFDVDKNSFVINPAGQRLQGYAAINGVLTSTVSDITIPTQPLPANPTANIQQELNLQADATAPNPATNPFNVNDPLSFNLQTNIDVFDSLGIRHQLSIYYIKDNAVTNRWAAQVYVDGAAATPVAPPVMPHTMDFSSTGAITTGNTFQVQFPPGGGATSPQNMTIDFTGSTQFAIPFDVRVFSQDGFTSGRLAGTDFDEDGILTGRYDNGQSQVIAKLAVARVPNVQGLANFGDTTFRATGVSGDPLISPGNADGIINPGTLESSNVDLSEELVSLINIQRNFQANAQVVQTADTLNQTTLGIFS